MDPRQQILSFVAEQLESISVGTGYSTDMQRVFSGKIIPTDKFNESDRQALCQVRYVSQTNEYSGQVTLDGAITYLISASMINATHEGFMGFLGDIEASIAASLHAEIVSDIFRVNHHFVSSVTIVGSTEYDELNDTLSPGIREQIAEIELSVDYTYLPEMLGGN